ncbi:hypothetical protein Tco_0442628 [Tanacetum coccineum]
MRKYTRYNAQSFNDAMICTMDSIRKYMLEIILHQQRTLHLLKQKTLMQTQEDHSHQTQAVNTDSLKVDLVVKQNSCSEKEDSNSETASSKSAKECSLNSKTTRFLSIRRIKRHSIEHWIPKQEFMSILVKMLILSQEYNALHVDQYQMHLAKMNLRIEVQHFRDTLLQHLGNVKKSIAERTRHLRQYERRVNKRQMQTQENIRPIYDEEPMAEVQLTAEWKISML